MHTLASRASWRARWDMGARCGAHRPGRVNFGHPAYRIKVRVGHAAPTGASQRYVTLSDDALLIETLDSPGVPAYRRPQRVGGRVSQRHVALSEAKGLSPERFFVLL